MVTVPDQLLQSQDPSSPKWHTGSHSPNLHAGPWGLRLQANSHGPRPETCPRSRAGPGDTDIRSILSMSLHLVESWGLRIQTHICGLNHQARSPADPGSEQPAQTPAASLLTEDTSQPTQNLWIASLTCKGFSCLSQSVKSERAACFLKCPDNARPQGLWLIKETLHH